MNEGFFRNQILQMRFVTFHLVNGEELFYKNVNFSEQKDLFVIYDPDQGKFATIMKNSILYFEYDLKEV